MFISIALNCITITGHRVCKIVFDFMCVLARALCTQIAPIHHIHLHYNTTLCGIFLSFIRLLYCFLMCAHFFIPFHVYYFVRIHSSYPYFVSLKKKIYIVEFHTILQNLSLCRVHSLCYSKNIVIGRENVVLKQALVLFTQTLQSSNKWAFRPSLNFLEISR